MLKPKTTLDQIQEQDEVTINSQVKYSCRIHPITRMSIPDFMDKDKSSMIDATCTIMYAVIPMMVNYLLNNAMNLMNIFFIGMQFGGEGFGWVCFGTVIGNLLVFYIVEYLGAGFAIVCSYFGSKEKEKVGLMYQKTLGLSFLICVVMTPVMYLTDKFLYLLQFGINDDKIDQVIVEAACAYVWAIIPSFYLYSFIDTNKNYLQSEGVIFMPIVIHLFAVIFHLLVMITYFLNGTLTLLRVAWIMNISNALFALTLYFFIILKEPTKESWVEWSQKAIHNTSSFLREVIHHQSYTYTQLIAFQILSVVICHSDIKIIDAHFAYAIVYNIIYFGYISITQCLSRSIAISIEENQQQICKKKISLGVFLMLLFSGVLILNIINSRTQLINFFIDDVQVAKEIESIVYIYCGVIMVSGFNSVLLGIVKTMELPVAWGCEVHFIYFSGIVVGGFLCYGFNYGLWGIWISWLGCLLFQMYLNLSRIICLDFDGAFDEIRNRYKIVEEDIRASKYEIAYQSQQNYPK